MYPGVMNMPYLIDGHNLIPVLGIKLSSLDDEEVLIDLLNQFCRISRLGQVEIFFDNGFLGGAQKTKKGFVTVTFVRRPMIADQAIRLRLSQLKNNAKNWTVISSDRMVQAEARSFGAKVTTSVEFAQKLKEALRSGPAGRESKPMSSQELNDWLTIFGELPEDEEKF